MSLPVWQERSHVWGGWDRSLDTIAGSSQQGICGYVTFSKLVNIGA